MRPTVSSAHNDLGISHPSYEIKKTGSRIKYEHRVHNLPAPERIKINTTQSDKPSSGTSIENVQDEFSSLVARRVGEIDISITSNVKVV